MIFYFSATGNTRWAALRLSQALREQLFFVPEAMAHPQEYHLKPGERLGFVFPVHGWRVPAFMREFISQVVIHAPATPYAYCLCTAGDSVGDTLCYLRQSIQRNASLRSLGVEDVSSAWSLIMPESYVGLPFMDVDKPEREREKKQRAAERLTGIVESVLPHHRQAFPRGERPLRALRYLRQRLPHARHRGRPWQRAPMEARRPLPHLLQLLPPLPPPRHRVRPPHPPQGAVLFQVTGGLRQGASPTLPMYPASRFFNAMEL